MSRRQSVKRGVAMVSSGALVVGAGAAVGVLTAEMSGQWSDQAAIKAAAQVVEDPGNDDPIPRAVIVTRIKERHVTPEPVEVHRKVYVRVPSGTQGTRAQAARAKASTPQRRTAAPAPKPRPSRKVVAPAPAAPKAPASAPKAKSTTS